MPEINPTKMAKLLAEGLHKAEIARRLGVTEAGVGAYLRRHGLTAGPVAMRTAVRRELAANPSWTYQDIADAVGSTAPNVLHHALGDGHSPRRDKSQASRIVAVIAATPSLTHQQVANVVGCSLSTVRRISRKAGLPPRRTSRKLSARDADAITTLLQQGVIYREIAERCGCSMAIVAAMARAAGIRRTRGPRKSEAAKVVARKPKSSKAPEIIELAKKGVTYREIGERLGCTTQRAQQVASAAGIRRQRGRPRN